MLSTIKSSRLWITGLITLSITACMSPEMNDDIPFHLTVEITEKNTDDTLITRFINYNNYGAGAGKDNIFGSADDDILGYSINKIYNEKNIQIWYSSMGEDNKWFTEDDKINNYNISGSLNEEYRFYSSPGNDGVWLTSDDIPSIYKHNQYQHAPYSSYTSDDNIVYLSSLGYDQLPQTDDDVILSYEKIIIDNNTERKINYISAGIDGIWFTNDDSIELYNPHISDINVRVKYGYSDKVTTTDNEFTVVSVNYYTSGDDNLWFTQDDKIVHSEINRWVETLLIEKIIVTDDNQVYHHHKILYDNNNNFTKILFTNKRGNDGKFNSGDEPFTTALEIDIQEVTEDYTNLLITTNEHTKFHAVKIKKNRPNESISWVFNESMLSVCNGFYETSLCYFKAKDLGLINGNIVSDIVYTSSSNTVYYGHGTTQSETITSNSITTLRNYLYNFDIQGTIDFDNYDFHNMESDDKKITFSALTSSLEITQVDDFTTKEITKSYHFDEGYITDKKTTIKIDKTILDQ